MVLEKTCYDLAGVLVSTTRLLLSTIYPGFSMFTIHREIATGHVKIVMAAGVLDNQWGWDMLQRSQRLALWVLIFSFVMSCDEEFFYYGVPPYACKTGYSVQLSKKEGGQSGNR